MVADAHLLRIFIGESDKHEGMPLYAWLVRQARQEGITGATVLRGIEGYGAKNEIHTARILQLSTDLPIVIEMIDSLEKLETLIPIIDKAMGDGLVTLEKVNIRIHRNKRE